MHVISKVKLREFWVQHADSEDALNDWYKWLKQLAEIVKKLKELKIATHIIPRETHRQLSLSIELSYFF